MNPIDPAVYPGVVERYTNLGPGESPPFTEADDYQIMTVPIRAIVDTTRT